MFIVCDTRISTDRIHTSFFSSRSWIHTPRHVIGDHSAGIPPWYHPAHVRDSALSGIAKRARRLVMKSETRFILDSGVLNCAFGLRRKSGTAARFSHEKKNRPAGVRFASCRRRRLVGYRELFRSPADVPRLHTFATITHGNVGNVWRTIGEPWRKYLMFFPSDLRPLPISRV